ncbi:MAG: hypothetical protein OEY22_08080 [Candidatus Bathyarchaeota archaeon]|nr:hypothetical protein [Candidatus Bathyarchaeota archaeon]
MSFVKCAFCSKIKGASEMYYCPHCEIWMCGEHVGKPLFGRLSCPRCGREVKGR